MLIKRREFDGNGNVGAIGKDVVFCCRMMCTLLDTLETGSLDVLF